MIELTDPDHAAISVRRRELQQTIAGYGDPSPESLGAREGLAHRLLISGHFAEALDECLRLRAGWDELGPDLPGRLLSRRLTLWALGKLGRLDEAEAEARQILEDYSRLDGPNSAAALASRSSLISIMGRNGKAAEALEQCPDLVRSCLRELGPDHAVTQGARIVEAELHGGGAGRPTAAADRSS